MPFHKSSSPNPSLHTRSFLLCFLILWILPNKLFPQYSETIYDLDDGLPHNTVLDIDKDENGFLWITTFNGICRFDGHRFKEYKEKFGQGEVSVSDNWGVILKDYRSRIWISNSLNSLFLYDAKGDKLHKVNEANSIYWDMVSDPGGNFWVSGSNSLVHWTESNDLEFHSEQYNLPEEIHGVYFLHLQSDGTLIISAMNGLSRVRQENREINIQRITCIDRRTGSEITFNDSDPEVGPFLSDGEKLYLIAVHGIYRTNIPAAKEAFEDSVVVIEKLVLSAPEVGLEPGQKIYAAVMGRKNEIIFRSVHGIYRYNLISGSADRIKEENHRELDTGEGEFRTALYYDSTDVIWAGTDYGLLKIVLPNKCFHSIRPDPENPTGLKSGKLNQAIIDSRGHLWIGMISDGLYHSIPDENGAFTRFEHYMPDPEDPNSLYSATIPALFEDSRHILWIGNQEFQGIDLNQEEVKFFSIPGGEYEINRGSGVVAVAEDPSGNILTTGFYPDDADWLYSFEKKRWYLMLLDSSGTSLQLPKFLLTREKDFYLLTNKKVFKLTNSWRFVEEEPVPGSNFQLFPVAYPDKLETLLSMDTIASTLGSFIATESGPRPEIWLSLMYRHKLLRFDFENTGVLKQSPESIDFYFIYDIIEDNKGRIWCSTMDGLFSIDPQTNLAKGYYIDDGLPVNRLYWGISKDPGGRILVCTTDGLLYFYPDSIVSDPPPRVQLTELLLFDNRVNAGDFPFLPQNISLTNSLTLPHDQNYLGFRFSALIHRNTDRIGYKYRLDGVDRDWVYTEKQYEANYLNLRPGHYTLRMMAVNGNNVWSDEETTLKINIRHPFWFRWWAILTYSILGLLLVAVYIRFRERNLKQRALLLERTVDEKTSQILEQRKEVDEMKSRFYTNISHEFRTPLTLLIAPLEDSLKKKQEDEGISRKVRSIMLRNARRLQRLINQLLDISKLESGKMELQLVKANLSDLVRTVASSFLSLAESRGIQFAMNIDQETEASCFDADKMEKITTNLLSNAFKFCSADGTVSLGLEYSISDDGENRALAILSVEDTGKGMEKEQLERIFDRFYQVSDSDTREAEGTGIGLALTKELVDLMHGKIEVESKPGIGSLFRVSLPVSEEYFREQGVEVMETSGSGNEKAGLLDFTGRKEGIEVGTEGDEVTGEDKETGEDEHDGKDKKTKRDKKNQGEVILVVEDNPDLREYIVGQFRGQYRVIEAENGKKGMEKAIQQIPDLVITDLMMPVMGGMEFCRKLKEHPATNHIPVIMLTAKADKESRLEGLEAAADDYIIKPFDSELLLARARNLIHQRAELRKRFQNEWILGTDEKLSASPQYGMMREIVKVIDEHLDDPDFDLASMASRSNMSNRGLYRKIRAITGTTPHELIRIMRLKRAASLFRSGERNVAQVMYRVGMRNTSHFASSFRKYFGVNPGDYRNPPES
jgi:signal transduction histidine kinase/CheY-like chemotaxis protein/AraC-like DNA-binding protein/ligand-binding sensor domain-containing protein